MDHRWLVAAYFIGFIVATIGMVFWPYVQVYVLRTHTWAIPVNNWIGPQIGI